MCFSVGLKKLDTICHFVQKTRQSHFNSKWTFTYQVTSNCNLFSPKRKSVLWTSTVKRSFEMRYFTLYVFLIIMFFRTQTDITRSWTLPHAHRSIYKTQIKKIAMKHNNFWVHLFELFYPQNLLYDWSEKYRFLVWFFEKLFHDMCLCNI